MSTIEVIDGAGLRQAFPHLDSKFHNSGNADALIWQLSVIIRRCTIDTTPELKLHAYLRDSLIISASNIGWGDATDIQVELTDDTFARVFPGSGLRKHIPLIQTGQSSPVTAPHWRDATSST